MKKALLLILLLLITAPLLSRTIEDDDDSDDDFFNFPFGRHHINRSWRDNDKDTDTQTLAGSGKSRASGFGGPSLSLKTVNDQQVLFTGGRGAAIFNDVFILGGGGFGLTNSEDGHKMLKDSSSTSYSDLNMGYGGILVGFNFFQKSVINFSLTSLIGAGGIQYNEITTLTENLRGETETTSKSISQEFFVAEPTLMLHLNVTKWMRVGCGMSYMYTRGIHQGEIADDDFGNYSFVGAVDFGWF